MTKLYRPVLLVLGVFLLSLLMYCLRQQTVMLELGKLLMPVLLFVAGVVLGVLVKPVPE